MVGLPNVPSPVPLNTNTVVPNCVAIAKSALPSPLKSAVRLPIGSEPVG